MQVQVQKWCRGAEVQSRSSRGGEGADMEYGAVAENEKQEAE